MHIPRHTTESFLLGVRKDIETKIKIAREISGESGPTFGVQVVFSKVNPETNILEVLINPNGNTPGHSTDASYLMEIDFFTPGITLSPYFPGLENIHWRADQTQAQFQGLPETPSGKNMSLSRNEPLDRYESFMPILALSNLLLNSSTGEFYNNAEKVTGSPISEQEIKSLIDCAAKFLPNGD
jgi:hypothetical protein